MGKYEKMDKVGEGTYGKVYKAMDKGTGKLVALKKTKHEIDEEGIPPTALREIDLLKRISESIYVVRLLCVEYNLQSEASISSSEPISQSPKSSLYLVFEYLDTDLKKFIDSHFKGSLEPSIVQRLMFQLCKGVAHCHSHGVLHRDLKPQNLLLNKGKEILKIADFGLARAFVDPLKTSQEIVTLPYRAPELLLGSSHHYTGVDIWSVGCIFAEMIRSRTLFHGDSQFKQLLRIFRLLGTPTEEQWPGVMALRNWHDYPNWKSGDLSHAVPSLSPEGVDLLAKMLRYNPDERISAEAALDHPYFDSLDKSQF